MDILPAHPQRKSALPLIHICTHSRTHDLAYKADMNEIKMKEGRGVTAYHNTEKIKSNVALLL